MTNSNIAKSVVKQPLKRLKRETEKLNDQIERWKRATEELSDYLEGFVKEANNSKKQLNESRADKETPSKGPS